MITLILTSALVCTNVNNLIVCNPVSQGEARALENNQLVSTFARICMAKVRADKRDEYPGGWIQLVRDCEEYGRLEAKRLRSVDQTSLQR